MNLFRKKPKSEWHGFDELFEMYEQKIQKISDSSMDDIDNALDELVDSIEDLRGFSNAVRNKVIRFETEPSDLDNRRSLIMMGNRTYQSVSPMLVVLFERVALLSAHLRSFTKESN